MLKGLLEDTAQRAIRYLEGLSDRRVFPEAAAIRLLGQLGGPLPDDGMPASSVLSLLDQIGSEATVASAGPRYFGFVTGGSLPAALAANWLAGAWDQNAALEVASPVSARLEEIALGWLVEIFGLPQGTAGGFVTGATMANFCGLAAARHAVLQKVGWDVEGQGLFKAPEIQVVVGEEVHASLLKALGMLGLGRERLYRVPVDRQGRMRATALPPLTEPAIVCLQAGNVNTGAFDPAAEILPRVQETGAWAHVDGAFGLWAAATPEFAHLLDGYQLADSWATDCHKWLNVPYDCGLVICRDPQALQSALATQAAYLISGVQREPSHFTPELSRRARGVEVWAALRSLGRSGLQDLVARNCRLAGRMADGFRSAGYSVLNEVVLNQVMVAFGEEAVTQAVIADLQAEGTCWCGGTVWQGRTAMRVSVSSWATADHDVDRCLEAILRIARKHQG